MVQQKADVRTRPGFRLTWPKGLPVLRNHVVELRELIISDAETLLRQFNTPAVIRYIAPPPSSVEGFEQFIRLTHMERRRGTLLCFGIVPAGESVPVGLIQIWPIKTDFSTAEWGFVLGQQAWGTGLFVASAELFLDYVFETIGVIRLETRAVVENGRSGGALRKLGATREGILRGAFKLGESVFDDVMWSILAEEWRARRVHAGGDL